MLSNNKGRALAVLVAQGPMHRAGLARELGVSRTTITNVVTSLAEDGLLIEEQGGGLKANIMVTEKGGVLVSAVFRIRETGVAVASPDGRVLAFTSLAVAPDLRGQERLDAAIEATTGLLEGLGRPPVSAASLAVNTQVDVRSGEVLGGEASRMWAGTNPLHAFAPVVGQAPVRLENTARLIGLAEHLCAPRRQAHNLVYVHLAHGVALGQVVGGHIIQGSHGGAGELGHVSLDPDGPPCACANRGCLMQYVGEEAVLGRARAILGGQASVADLVTEALAGNHACRAVLTDIGVTLGRALVMVCNLLDPDVLAVGGDLARAGDLLTRPVATTVGDYALPLVTRSLRVVAADPSIEMVTVVRAGFHALRQDEEIMRVVVGRILEARSIVS